MVQSPDTQAGEFLPPTAQPPTFTTHGLGAMEKS
jgi:hypothetical protein